MAKMTQRAGARRAGAPTSGDIAALVAALPGFDLAGLSLCWRNHLGGAPPTHLPRWLFARVLAFRVQAAAHGDLDRAMALKLKQESGEPDPSRSPFVARAPATRDGVDLRPGALLTREWRGKLERVTALEQGFAWNGRVYGSLSQVAKAITGTSWNGHRFFGLRSAVRSSARAASLKTPGRSGRPSCVADVEAPR